MVAEQSEEGATLSSLGGWRMRPSGYAQFTFHVSRGVALPLWLAFGLAPSAFAAPFTLSVSCAFDASDPAPQTFARSLHTMPGLAQSALVSGWPGVCGAHRCREKRELWALPT